MAPLTPEDVEIIEKRLAKGKWPEDLVKEFLAEGRGSKTAVYRKIKRWTETGSAKHIPKPSGRRRTVTPEENAWMLEQLRKDSSLALDDLQSLLLTERDTYRSKSSIYRAMN
jgi:transposase